MREVISNQPLLTIEVLAGAVAAALVLHWLIFRAVRVLERRRRNYWAAALRKHCYTPTRLLMIAAFASATLSIPLDDEQARVLRHALALILIAVVAWLVIRLSEMAESLLIQRVDISRADNRAARKLHTQAAVFQRVVAAVVAVFAGAAMLTTFPQARIMGTSILASAGILGLVLGLAAQSTLSNLLAGIQIAATDPIRIDDVVVVEGEWGRVEEITFTYVVIRIWDERRLILPISYFTSHPFENWTRTGANILGTVFLKVDYTVPVQELRHELSRLAGESRNWDGRLAILQATDAGERTIELRALVSSGDSSASWDLRCEVREGLIGFLQERYPETLPKTRAELFTPSGLASAGAV